MNKQANLFLIAVAITFASAQDASAQYPGGVGFGFQPFGFYQPYGVQYRTRTATPPYFALNPPVYYGARYSRPYGISPFASPPVVGAPESFKGRLRSDHAEGLWREGAPRQQGSAGCCNPFIHASSSQPAAEMLVAVKPKKGAVRRNPFVVPEEQIVSAR
ncbi:MAG: hypothetical protein AAF989_07560 [Planctomycetota bacterium]